MAHLEAVAPIATVQVTRPSALRHTARAPALPEPDKQLRTSDDYDAIAGSALQFARELTPAAPAHHRITGLHQAGDDCVLQLTPERLCLDVGLPLALARGRCSKGCTHCFFDNVTESSLGAGETLVDDPPQKSCATYLNPRCSPEGHLARDLF